jgi:hypothetical protein
MNISIPSAMRAKGYNDVDAKDDTLQKQVRRLAADLKQKFALASAGPPEAAAATAILALAASSNAMRRIPLALIDLNAQPVFGAAANAFNPAAGGIRLPSPIKSTRRTTHQKQVDNNNQRKQKLANAQAHARATSLVAEERQKPIRYRHSTNQIIKQVEREFKVRGHPVTLAKATINRYVRLGMIGEFPIHQGFCGQITTVAFKLLVLASESHIQIAQVNSVSLKRLDIIRIINKCCGVVEGENGQIKTSLYDRVMKATSVLLDAAVSPAVEERRLMWTTYDNLNAWFRNWKDFLVEKGFARRGVEMEDEIVINKAMRRRIINVDETEILLDGSSSRAGGRPAVSFHNPKLPMANRLVSKSSHACTGIFGSTAAGECIPPHWQLPTSATTKMRKFKMTFSPLFSTHEGDLDVRRRGSGLQQSE